MERMRVPPACDESWEAAFHAAGTHDRLTVFGPSPRHPQLLRPRGHRAIGVVYDPEWDRHGNFVPTVLPRRYDAFLYLHETHALHPHLLAPHHTGEPPETYPFGV
jgi:erythromycin esterase